MRRVIGGYLSLFAIAGCGRIGFEAAPSDATGVDACVDTGQYLTVSGGTFESGDLAAWASLDMPTRGTAAVVDSPAIGARSLRMTPSQPSSGPGYALVQSLPVSPGRPYVLGGYLDASQLSSTEGIYFDLYDVPFDNNVRAQNGIAGWQFVYMLFTPPEGVTTVDVRIVHDGTMDPARSAFADDVALTPEPEFVPPSPCP